MTKLELFYPAKPYRVTQGWGIFNPAYQQFGFTRHNGEDFALGADAKLYAPIRGTVVKTGNQQSGGGIFLGIMSDDVYDDGARVLIDLLHCQELLIKEGDHVEVGDVVAIADNTGFSTGPHTHGQYRRIVGWNGKIGDALSFSLVDTNDANNSFDPRPFWNGYYATDATKVTGILKRIISLLQQALKTGL